MIKDLPASIYRAAGSAPNLAYEIERRPFYATTDGEGKSVAELFG